MAAGQAILASGVHVTSVRSEGEREAFISLPWRIYRDDPAWVPPLRREVARFLSPEHPFLRHGAAHLFLAHRGAEVVGRILVSDDPHFNERHATNAGMFGMFESVNDRRVATALLEAAAGWLAARGRNRMLGPIEYSTNYTCGLLVDGFETPPRLLMNHNPPYYEALLTGYGLRPVKELYAWWIDSVPELRGWQRRAQRVAARGVRIRTIRRKNLAAEVERAKRVYNEAWFNNWGFVRMTDAEFTDLGHHLAEIADERLMFVAELGDEPVAFSLALPDVNEAFRAVPDGRLLHWGLPTGLLRLLVEMRRIRTFRFFTLGVRPAYQGRGIAEALVLRTLDAALAAGYTGCEMGWTLDDNERINRAIQRVGA
ncbi:MAG TPA: GNAT family N-acetyltransferase, partial [candidate division Zixibacteria bacterium]|nr:GNAT family N-acetyltransferase [candidate division Zixibacteria bacterium]